MQINDLIHPDYSPVFSSLYPSKLKDDDQKKIISSISNLKVETQQSLVLKKRTWSESLDKKEFSPASKRFKTGSDNHDKELLKCEISKLSSILDIQEDIFDADEKDSGYVEMELGNRFFQSDADKDISQAIYYYKAAADKGNIDAFHQLASIYRKGKKIPQDLEKSAYYYTRLSETDEIGFEGLLKIAKIYKKQKHTIPNAKEKYVQCYKLFSDLGESEASFKLAQLYEKGRYVECDLVQAEIYYEKATEQGCVDAKVALAAIYLSRLVPSENEIDKALEYCEEVANLCKHPEALYLLGEMYSFGIGNIEQNSSKAFNFYYLAATYHHMQSAYKYGLKLQDESEHLSSNAQFEMASKIARYFNQAYQQKYVKARKKLIKYYSSKEVLIEFNQTLSKRLNARYDKLTYSLDLSMRQWIFEGTQSNSEGVVCLKKAISKCSQLNATAIGVRFNQDTLVESLNNGTCTSMAINFIKSYFKVKNYLQLKTDFNAMHLLEGIARLGSHFSHSSSKLRTLQAAYNTVEVMDTHSDHSKNKIVSILSSHSFSCDDYSDEIDVSGLRENNHLIKDQLKQLIEQLSDGVFFIRQIQPTNNTKLEVCGHSSVYIKEGSINILYEPNMGAKNLAHTDYIENLIKIIYSNLIEFNITHLRFYRVLPNSSSICKKE